MNKKTLYIKIWVFVNLVLLPLLTYYGYRYYVFKGLLQSWSLPFLILLSILIMAIGDFLLYRNFTIKNKQWWQRIGKESVSWKTAVLWILGTIIVLIVFHALVSFLLALDIVYL
ncbi:hypothetical protein COV20_02160 [Candidatus Woesearchaeota archaeon CG10_big_fil_rev_8_21_14_0_10_45_16]|nr:MAG: hypothetical protein COV20_02160 [Candidatus Woesearchaeota archaeon CG10_big_fil_rev_8_21_14_0_10_45_16]